MRNTVFVKSTVYNNQNVPKSVQYVTLSYGRPRTKPEVTTNTYIERMSTWLVYLCIPIVQNCPVL